MTDITLESTSSIPTASATTATTTQMSTPTKPIFYISSTWTTNSSLSFTTNTTTMDDNNTDNDNNNSSSTIPIYIQEDWTHGIGGGLWSMGMAMAKYFMTDHAQQQLLSLQQRRRQQQQNNNNNRHPHRHRHGGLRILELGSGNGFLSVCILAIFALLKQQQAKQQQTQESEFFQLSLNEIIITDTREHLPLIEKTIHQLNPMIHEMLSSTTNTTTNTTNTTKIQIQEYQWATDQYKQLVSSSSSSFHKDDDHDDGNDNDNNDDYDCSGFDLILGSDLAYRDELHDPLIQTFLDCTNDNDNTNTNHPSNKNNNRQNTIILLGVTMNDTKSIFFHKLQLAGFHYERLSDHLIDTSFRGMNFGIFVIVRKKNE